MTTDIAAGTGAATAVDSAADITFDEWLSTALWTWSSPSSWACLSTRGVCAYMSVEWFVVLVAGFGAYGVFVRFVDSLSTRRLQTPPSSRSLAG